MDDFQGIELLQRHFSDARASECEASLNLYLPDNSRKAMVQLQ
jgi:hypothetical protein